MILSMMDNSNPLLARVATLPFFFVRFSVFRAKTPSEPLWC